MPHYLSFLHTQYINIETLARMVDATGGDPVGVIRRFFLSLSKFYRDLVKFPFTMNFLPQLNNLQLLENTSNDGRTSSASA
jgi:hypothetical protein